MLMPRQQKSHILSNNLILFGTFQCCAKFISVLMMLYVGGLGNLLSLRELGLEGTLAD